MMQLPLDFCNLAQTAVSLKMLMDIVKDHGDIESTQNIGMFLPGTYLK